MYGFIAQLVENRTGIAEVTGSNPVEALIFFRLLLSNCLNWKIYCDDHSSLWSTTAAQIYELFHIYFTSFHSRENELNKLASLPMYGFIAQLVENRTGIAEVTGSNPVEALIFFRLLLSNCLNWKIYCDDHSSLWSTTAAQIYELFHIYFTSFHSRENELNKLASLPMYGFIAQLVENRTGIAEVTGSNPVEALIFFQASSFQLLKLENLLRWSFFTLIYNRSSNIWIISYILHIISLTGEWTQ